jgi:hypothetical protein
MKAKLAEVISLCKKLDATRINKSAAEELRLAGINLFEYSTFRLPAHCNRQRTIGFTMIKAALIRAIRQTADSRGCENTQGIIISSSSCDHANVQFYIGSMSGQHKLQYIVKDKLSFRGQFSISEWIAWFLFALRQAIVVFFSTQRSNRALTIIEVLEITALLKIIQRHRIDKVFDFVPFEVDSNFLYLCTRELGTMTTKIPSPGPLSTHNKILLCDMLVLSSGYHFDELPLLSKNYRFSQQLVWAPERAHTYYNLYARAEHPEHHHHIGFYSHGEWVRKMKGLVKETSLLFRAEEDTLHMLGRFVGEHPEYNLTIYPHPKERKSFSLDQLTEYYRKTIGHANFKIASADKGTTFRFHEVDVAITCYSTIIFERLYCGFKTIIKRIEEHDFPIDGSPLNHICFDDYNQLSTLILAATEVDRTRFFESHQLNSYLHHHFPTPISTHG